MKEQFRHTKFKEQALEHIEQMNECIEEVAAQGIETVTGRQLHYLMVGKNHIPNTKPAYKALMSLLTAARYAGLIDWDAVEDREREVARPLEFDNLRHRVDSALANYRLKRWEGQDIYVELWVEKRTLLGIFERVADEFHVAILANKGYSSAAAMYQAAQRLSDQVASEKIIVYVGDHDPSGNDMVRDIRDRLAEFNADVEIRKILLTRAQVDQYHLPPNPANSADSRYEDYVEEHGVGSWEVEALPPSTCIEIARRTFRGIVDWDLMSGIIDRETSDKEVLRRAAERIR